MTSPKDGWVHDLPRHVEPFDYDAVEDLAEAFERDPWDTVAVESYDTCTDPVELSLERQRVRFRGAFRRRLRHKA
jgi:hypothetical protein